jgi:hypothetical protein
MDCIAHRTFHVLSSGRRWSNATALGDITRILSAWVSRIVLVSTDMAAESTRLTITDRLSFRLTT